MADERDVRALRIARTEFARRGVDTSRADLHISHGVLMVRGILNVSAPLRREDLKHEIEVIAKVLRSKSEFRDVIYDLAIA